MFFSNVLLCFFALTFLAKLYSQKSLRLKNACKHWIAAFCHFFLQLKNSSSIAVVLGFISCLKTPLPKNTDKSLCPWTHRITCWGGLLLLKKICLTSKTATVKIPSVHKALLLLTNQTNSPVYLFGIDEQYWTTTQWGRLENFDHCWCFSAISPLGSPSLLYCLRQVHLHE